jgi:PKD repeat protein
MKKLLTLLFVFCAGIGLADEVPIFKRMTGGASLPQKLFTVSPSQVPLGVLSEIVVTGENFVPRNHWRIKDVKIVKERFIDSKTMILTVFAQGSTGLRSLALDTGTLLSIEVTPSDILLNDDFEDGDISDWHAQKGQWTAASGQCQINTTKPALLFPMIPNTDNVVIDFDMTLNSGKFAGIYFQYRNKQNFRSLIIDGEKGFVRLKDRFNNRYEAKKKIPISNIYNTSHHYTLAINNSHIALSIDSTPTLDVDLDFVYSGQIALYAKAASAQFDNVVVSKDPDANAIPIADYNISIVERSVSFNGSASVDPDGNLVSYNWNFGDGHNASGQTTDHDYSHNGTFSVTLAVTDNSGAQTKIVKSITVQGAISDEEAIKQVVRRFFDLLADLETLTAQQICEDFSHSPSCPAYNKQVNDIADAQPDIQWFDVEFLSGVSVVFESPTQAYPVRIRNKLLAMYYGDPALYYTDGWHTYRVQKEGDGKWHQCSYTFQLISTNED